jgi:hypothetical protein
MFLRSDFKPGDPVRLVASAAQTNRVANILNTLEVIGGRLERSYSAEGKDWLLVIDGANSGQFPEGTMQPATSDRLFAVDSLSLGRIGRQNFTGFDTYGYVAERDLHIRHDLNTDSTFSGVAYHQIRSYVKVADTTAPPVQVLGRTAGGKLVWVALDSECPNPPDE